MNTATPINQGRLIALTQAAINSLHALLREIGAEPGGHQPADPPYKSNGQVRTAPSPKCPDCGGEMKQRTSSRGPFWGCRQYPHCQGTRPGGSANPNSQFAPGNSESDSWAEGRQ